MTDRELLEKAAKAAGYEMQIVGAGSEAYGVWYPGSAFTPTWNPLTDDGDALRLAVKVGLFPSIFPSPEGCTMVTAHNKSSFDLLIEEAHGNDPYAATRRAIVRAAAAMSEE